MRWTYSLFMFFLSLTKGYADPNASQFEKIEMGEMKNKRVLISGAGIAGLSLAYWLKQYGFIPTVVEKHQSLRTGGYKVDIRGVAIDVVKRMGVHHRIDEVKTYIQGVTLIDSSGRSVTTMAADLSGGRMEGDLEIMRGDLCEILFGQVKDVEFLFGDTITKIIETDEGVAVEFGKSAPRVFDLVIGADGLHSTVRKLVFGEESELLKDLGPYVSVFSIPNFFGLECWEIECFVPQRYINVYSARGDAAAKVAFAFSANALQGDRRDTAQQKKILEEAFSHIGWDQLPRILAAMKEAPDFYFDSVAQVQMSHWSKGRIVLVGDAGYAVSSLSGQGTSVALIGAYVLAGELAESRGDYKIAFSSYEKGLSRFVRKNQKIVQASIDFIEEKNPILTWLHRHCLRILPEKWVAFFKNRGNERIHDAATDLELKDYKYKSN